MADAPREAWITGIGIVSCLGEGADAHWQGLTARRRNVDAETFAPYLVHPLAPLNLDQQIPKKGDQRQMEAWQRIGTYAAGLALADAGVKGNAELLAHMDMIVAAGGGERDIAVDGTILTNKSKAANPEAFLNERLMSDLRPTLFLAQLSNLLAGNISIVHGVTGSSRTFMGEEVGRRRRGAHRACAHRRRTERTRAGGRLAQRRARGPAAALRCRRTHVARRRSSRSGSAQNGMVLGSLGAFLVLEARGHAEARGAKPLARLSRVVSERSSRPAGAVTAALGADVATRWRRRRRPGASR